MLSESALRLASEMLELASDEFSSHCCNDLVIDNTPENFEFIQDMHNWNERCVSKEKPSVTSEGDKIITMDWFVMSYLSHLLEEEAEQMEDRDE